MSTVLKYPGSKWRLSKWIIENIPKHRSYLEPYFGSGAIFFNKKPSPIETINDIDGDVVNLFKVIRNQSEELIKSITYTPFSREEYDNCYIAEKTDNEIESARRFLIKCWQSIGASQKHKSGWKNDVQGREAAYAMRNWYRLPEKIYNTVDRLKEVQIENRPAIDVIKRFNFENVFIYADPPYVLSTRKMNIYKNEMTDQEHIELLKLLIQHKGPAIISGYDNDIYNYYLKNWKKLQKETLVEQGLKRTETLWIKN